MSKDKVIIIGEFTVLPENIDKCKVLFSELAEKSQAENGCEVYNVNQVSNDENVFIIYEVFTDKDAHEYHKGTEHFLQLLKVDLAPYIVDKKVRYLI